MKSKKTAEGFLLVLQKGELLIESLQSFCKQQNITGGFVTGLGAVLNAELGYYDLANKQYHWKKFDELMEITALSGTISENMAHVHVTLAGEDYRTIGGHLKEATIGGTCEIYLEVIDGKLERKLDGETGLKLIDIL